MDKTYKTPTTEIPNAGEPIATYGQATKVNRTVFNEAQIELLNVMATIQNDDELMALKHAISEFFARRADEELERLWQSGEWSEQTLHNLQNTHFRTPYKQ